MTITVFLAVILAALLHAIWNAMVKSGSDKHASMTAIVLGHLPIAILILPFAPQPELASIPWIVGSLVIHLGYQLFLVSAYRIGELTQVYPIARGFAPLVVSLVSVLFLGEILSTMQTAAIILISIGITSISLVHRADGKWNNQAVIMALITGCFIASYSLIDGVGARVADTALGYWTWAAIGNAVVFSLWTAFTQPQVFKQIHIDKNLQKVGLLGGTASYLAYGIVIWGFTQAPIALVTALRETSIIFAVLIGVVVLKERLSLAKVISTAITISGMILLRFSKQ